MKPHSVTARTLGLALLSLLLWLLPRAAAAAAPSPTHPSDTNAPPDVVAESAEDAPMTSEEPPPEPGTAEPSEPAHGEPATADSGTEVGSAPRPSSPYQAIIARNPFGLKTPPPPQPVPDTTQPPVNATALKLTGITTLLGGKRAMFVLQEPGKQQLNSDLVSEGERDSVITNLEVIQIDERAAVVRVNYGGKELALNFVDNGLKPPAGPAAPTQPGPGGRVVPVAAGGPRPGGPNITPQPATLNTLPAATSIQSGANQNPSGLRSIPVRQPRLPVTSAFGSGGAENMPEANIPPEHQAIMLKVQEQVANQSGIPFPPSPPIPGVDNINTVHQDVLAPNVNAGGFSIAPPPIPGQVQQ